MKVDLLATMGARFLVTPDDDPIAGASVPVPVTGRMPGNVAQRVFVREIHDANTGHFSPTEVTRTAAAKDIVALLDSNFDFHRQVVVADNVALPQLVPAKSGAFSYGQGKIHVTASSEGTSLLLLPIQYSNCLQPASMNPGVRLVRANLAFLGMLFDKEADVSIEFKFGFWSTACRQRDIEDLKSLGLQSIQPAASQDRNRSMPYALRNGAAGDKLSKFWADVLAAAAADRTQPPHFSGPIAQFIKGLI